MRESITMLMLLVSFGCLGQLDSVSRKGFYIPRDLDECHRRLEKTMSGKAKKMLADLEEKDLQKVSLMIIPEWFDADSSRLTQYFRSFSILDEEEAEEQIKLSFFQLLNNRPYDLPEVSRGIKARQDSLDLASRIKYEADSKADSLEGTFIPTDLHSCFSELDKILNDSTRLAMKQQSDLYGYHLGLGRWIRNNWGLWSGSRLKVYFRQKNVSHPDNMSGLILEGYLLYLNGKPVEIEKLIADQAKEAEEMVQLPAQPIDVTKFYTKTYKRFLKTGRIRKLEFYR